MASNNFKGVVNTGTINPTMLQTMGNYGPLCERLPKYKERENIGVKLEKEA